MEGAILLLVVGIPLLALALVLRALRRSKEIEHLRRRVRTLEHDFEHLRSRLPAPEERKRAAPPAEIAEPPQPPPAPAAASVAPAPHRTLERASARRSPLSGIEWEKWIGVRGFAVSGGVVMALAGIFFFKHAFDRGWISFPLRVALGGALGVACLVAGEVLRARAFRHGPAALSGAGIVVLDATFWAAHRRYLLFPFALSFAGMAVATALCFFLTIRHRSQVLAVLALVGGFATPLLLDMGLDRPLGLFGYLLLLDFGILAIGAREGWPLLGGLALVGTFLFEGLWVLRGMRTGELPLALAILAALVAPFAWATRAGRLWSRAGAVLLPFAFAVYFAQHVDFGAHLFPTGVFAILLGIGASAIGRTTDAPWLAPAAAAANVATTATWILSRELTSSLAWETAAVVFAQALSFHGFVEWGRASSPIEGSVGRRGSVYAGAIGLTGLSLCLVLGAAIRATAPLWPWIAGAVALAALVLRQARHALPALAVTAATAVGLVVEVDAWLPTGRGAAAGLPEPAIYFGLVVFLVAAFVLASLLAKEEEARAWRWRAAALLAASFLLPLSRECVVRQQGAIPFFAASLLLALAIAAAAAALRSWRWLAVGVVTVFGVQLNWLGEAPPLGRNEPALTLASLVLTSVVLSTWPLVVPSRFSRSRPAWWVAALVGPAWFWPARGVLVREFGDGFVALLPLLFALVSCACVLRLLPGTPSEPGPGGEEPARVRRSALVGFATVAAGFASLVVPLQVDVEWVAVFASIFGFALARLWNRFDAPALKALSVFALGSSLAILLVHALVPGHYARQARPILNWLLYVHGVPSLAAFACALTLSRHETSRARTWEAGLYRRGIPWAGAVAGGIGVLAAFLGLNLLVVDAFGVEPRIAVRVERLPTRDLVLSITWAAYALILLGFGMRRRSRGLRWASLICLLATLGKVFLYDLGELDGLYRVASLLGLAVSLIVVSLLYQRLVFRMPERQVA